MKTRLLVDVEIIGFRVDDNTVIIVDRKGKPKDYPREWMLGTDKEINEAIEEYRKRHESERCKQLKELNDLFIDPFTVGVNYDAYLQ